MLLAAVAVDPSPYGAVSPPHGWVPLRRSDYYSSNGERSQIFYKIARATEPSAYVFTTHGRHELSGGITAFEDVRNGRPIAASATRATARSTTVNAPSTTPRSTNTLLVFVGASTARESWLAPRNMTEQYQRSSKGSSVEVATQPWSFSRATGRRSATITRSAETAGVLIALAGTPAKQERQGTRGPGPTRLVTPQSASVAAASSPQGNWVGTYGGSGYDLAAWNGGSDVVAMPAASVTLVQGNRFVWGSNNSDVRQLESVDKSSRVAATYWDWSEIQVQLRFSSAYSGNLELYALDYDALGRRETITVGGQTATLNSDFSQGAWAIFPINVAAGSTLTIKVDNTGWPNAVLSGIFLGGAGTPRPIVQTQPQGSWVSTYGGSGYDLAAWNGGSDVVAMPAASVTLVQGNRFLWGSNNSDVRQLQSRNNTKRVAATYWDWSEIQVQLRFSSAYSGNLELYALDYDALGRRETITVGGQTATLNSDFSQGAWAIFPINVAAGSTLTIKVDNTGWPNAVLSGIFLGGGAPACDQVIWPGQSVVGLVNSLGPGQTGCLHGGTYSGDVTTGVSGSAGFPVTITSYPGERATVAGILYVPVGSDYLTFSHLNLVGTSAQSVSVQLYGNNATLLHDDITNNHQSGSCVEIGDYESANAAMVHDTTIEGNRIHDCGIASDGPHDHGIYVAASTNAVISDNLIWGTQGGWGVQLWTSSQGSLIAHNVIDQNYAGSVLIAGANVSPAFQPSSNNTIQYNLITNPTSGYNIASYWQNGATGSGNTVSSNCLYGAPSGDFDTSDGGFTQTNNLHANPQYTDPTNHNYRLQSTTPCLPLVGYDTATTQNPG